MLQKLDGFGEMGRFIPAARAFYLVGQGQGCGDPFLRVALAGRSLPASQRACAECGCVPAGVGRRLALRALGRRR